MQTCESSKEESKRQGRYHQSLLQQHRHWPNTPTPSRRPSLYFFSSTSIYTLIVPPPPFSPLVIMPSRAFLTTFQNHCWTDTARRCIILYNAEWFFSVLSLLCSLFTFLASSTRTIIGDRSGSAAGSRCERWGEVNKDALRALGRRRAVAPRCTLLLIVHSNRYRSLDSSPVTGLVISSSM